MSIDLYNGSLYVLIMSHKKGKKGRIMIMMIDPIHVHLKQWHNDGLCTNKVINYREVGSLLKLFFPQMSVCVYSTCLSASKSK